VIDMANLKEAMVKESAERSDRSGWSTVSLTLEFDSESFEEKQAKIRNLRKLARKLATEG